MEEESFSNTEVAAIMNRYFVSIKVDREERPDIDSVYMAFVQATSGRGGWPMSVFLTPDLKPFFGGSYFPRETFEALLKKVADEWAKNRERVLSSAGNITGMLRKMSEGETEGALRIEKALLDRTYESYASSYDSENGGFGPAPKFPKPVDFNFLLRYFERTGNRKALDMVAFTLRKMAQGGLHDPIGGGFHRYSTDARWFLPHFEKMLYDQAQLAVSYLEAYQLTGDAAFSVVARDVLDYVLRDMRSREAGFYSAEDADSSRPENPKEHGEGAFYVWTEQEVSQLLGSDAAIFNHYYGIRKAGNVDSDPFSEFKNRNVLSVSATLGQTAVKFGKTPAQVAQVLELSRKKLFDVRSRRPRPALDDKVLSGWNGLMISALCKGYQVLHEEKYLKAADAAAGLISDKLYDPKKRLLKRRYRDGDVSVNGLLEDYAFFTQGLLDLYETSFNSRYLRLAMELSHIQESLFWDEKRGGFYSTEGKDPSILLRMKEDYDGVEPSPNSVAVMNLLRLSQMTDDRKWRDMADKSIKAFERPLSQTPEAMPQMMVAVNYYLSKPRQVIIAGESKAADTEAIVREVHRRFLPNKIIFLADGGALHQEFAKAVPALNGLRRINGKATAYICENYRCNLPTNDVAMVARLLDRKAQ
jgi:hypothetical protein